MVKFEIEIPDNVWNNLKNNEGVKHMMADSGRAPLSAYKDSTPFDVLTDEDYIIEMVGYFDIGFYGDVIDIREDIKVKKLD